jgi:hypothetical protein
MNYIIEALLVGIYTCVIYLLFSPFITNFYMLLLVCGFFKHFLGSSFGLWTWYCNNGEACLKTLSQDQNYESNTLFLIRESIYEAILFLLVGSLLHLLVQNKIYLFLFMGIILHLWGEHIGLHKRFCIRTCDKIDESN